MGGHYNIKKASTANDLADFHSANTATMAEINLIKNKIILKILIN
jgi:hypothetical protein